MWKDSADEAPPWDLPVTKLRFHRCEHPYSTARAYSNLLERGAEMNTNGKRRMLKDFARKPKKTRKPAPRAPGSLYEQYSGSISDVRRWDRETIRVLYVDYTCTIRILYVQYTCKIRTEGGIRFGARTRRPRTASRTPPALRKSVIEERVSNPLSRRAGERRDLLSLRRH